VIGFLGILVLATQQAVLTNHEAKTLLEQAIKNGFQLSEKLHQQIIPVFNLQ
jgi:predicted nucleic acid-binding protein